MFLGGEGGTCRFCVVCEGGLAWFSFYLFTDHMPCTRCVRRFTIIMWWAYLFVVGIFGVCVEKSGVESESEREICEE